MSIGVINFPNSLDAASDLVEATNNAVTTLSTTINSSATTITVASTAGFPDTGILKIEDELIAYTAKTTTSPFEFTVQTSPAGRGFENTAAAGHAAGSNVELVITARSNNVKNDAIIALENKLGTGDSAPVAPANGASFLRAFSTGESYWSKHTTADLGFTRHDITSVATTTLAFDGPAVNEFYGTPGTLRTVRLPATLATASFPAEIGQSFVLINVSDNVFRVFNSANAEIGRVDIGQVVRCTCRDNTAEITSNWVFSVEGYLNYGYGTVVRNSNTGDGVGFLGGAGSSSNHWSLRLTPATLSANRTLTLPDKSGTIITSADTGTITAPLIASNAVETSKIINSAVTPEKLSLTSQGLVFRNRLINGDFAVAQRGTSFTNPPPVNASWCVNNNDTYNLDRWYLLSPGNNIVNIAQLNSDAPAGQLWSCRLQPASNSAGKFGLAQIIEQRNCVGLISQSCVLSFKARRSSNAAAANVRATVFAWTGAADVVTSDFVTNWNNTSSATDPVFSTAQLQQLGTTTTFSITEQWATYNIASVAVPANTSNLIIFIWSNATTLATTDFILLTDVQFEAGTTPTAYERLPYDVQLAQCQRYFLSVGGRSGFGGTGGERFFGGWLARANPSVASNTAICYLSVPVVMRVPPVSTQFVKGGTWRAYALGNGLGYDINNTNLTLPVSGETTITLTAYVELGGQADPPGGSVWFLFPTTADAYLGFGMEL